MKVTISNQDLLIEPETEFETEYLLNFKPAHVFHKTGQSTSHLLGLKILREENNEDTKINTISRNKALRIATQILKTAEEERLKDWPEVFDEEDL